MKRMIECSIMLKWVESESEVGFLMYYFFSLLTLLLIICNAFSESDYVVSSPLFHDWKSVAERDSC